MYRWVDHTSELELAIEAGTEAAVVADAVAALGELLDDGGEAAATETRAVTLTGSDRAALLAMCLEELVFVAETEGFVPERVEALHLSRDRLEAEVEGRLGRPPHLVKAVTYHRLGFERSGEGWRATVVLDV